MPPIKALVQSYIRRDPEEICLAQGEDRCIGPVIECLLSGTKLGIQQLKLFNMQTCECCVNGRD